MTFLALLAIVIGVLSMLSLVLVGLVEAPWPLLLVGLVAVLYGLQRLADSAVPEVTITDQLDPRSSQLQQKAATPAQTEGLSAGITPLTKSELIYRGVRVPGWGVVAAQPNTSVESSGDSLIYRGARVPGWEVVDRPGTTVEVSSDELIYRGVRRHDVRTLAQATPNQISSSSAQPSEKPELAPEPANAPANELIYRGVRYRADQRS